MEIIKKTVETIERWKKCSNEICRKYNERDERARARSLFMQWKIKQWASDKQLDFSLGGLIEARRKWREDTFADLFILIVPPGGGFVLSRERLAFHLYVSKVERHYSQFQ